MNLPNRLTLIRIFLVPIVMVFLIPGTEIYNYIALALFVAAAVTDWLDGHIARSRQQVTTLGKLLDPIADKLLISSVLISLVQIGRADAWLVAVMVGREIAVSGLRSIAASQGIVIAARELGKYKFGAEIAASILLIPNWFPPVGLIFLYIAMILSLASGVDYFLKFWKKLNLT